MVNRGFVATAAMVGVTKVKLKANVFNTNSRTPTKASPHSLIMLVRKYWIKQTLELRLLKESF